MNFLDKSGLQYLWTKIKASFGTALIITSKCEIYNDPNVNGKGRIIPFVTNHQFINSDTETNNNVYNWFQKASKGGTLEIVFTKVEGCDIYCKDTNGRSYMYKMALSTSTGPYMTAINKLNMQFYNYARLVKIDDNTLLVAEFVANKYTTSS